MDFSVLDLPPEILILICEQIETIDDKINFARTHPKLWDAFAEHSRKEVRSEICFDEVFEYVAYYDFFLEWWGPSLKSIDSVNVADSGVLVETAAKFCPNLEKIIFDVRNANIKKLEENLPKLKMLEHIGMEHLGEHTNASLIKSFQSLTNLRSLHFYFWSLKKSERVQLNKLIQLEELRIEAIDTDEITDILPLLGHLRVLTICHLDTTTLNYLAKHCTQLEKLSMIELTPSNYSNIQIFPYFSKLLRLNIDVWSEIYVNSFGSYLSNRYKNQLKGLHIHFLTLDSEEISHIAEFQALKQLSFREILPNAFDQLVKMPLEKIESRTLTQFDILRLVKECSSLKELTCRCDDIDEEFIPVLLDKLEKKGTQPDLPFKLTIICYIIFKTDLINQLAVHPKSNLLNLC
ncbi:uncharacterized protein LOC117781730 isoform X1 [Drosophila innubila]|uniref:uncharacterized protein LOC117781730 isoform X1 n=1 Tax=Drosophila innubila TaxID=198719 RepID=UPI00148DDCF8|nr:uncharacterized protein LOC117781730 isoform X1 [Drosophila innubila]